MERGPGRAGRPAAARRTDTEPLFCVGRDIVLAKSVLLCFRLTAKTRSAPLLVLSPRDPLRWARAGPLICAPNHVVPHTEKHHTPSPVILRPLGRRIRTPVPFPSCYAQRRGLRILRFAQNDKKWSVVLGAPHTEKHHTPSPVILRPLGRRIRNSRPFSLLLRTKTGETDSSPSLRPRKVRFALFPPDGENSLRSLARPLTTRPTSLGSCCVKDGGYGFFAFGSE